MTEWHPDNVEVKSFEWSVNGLYSVVLEVQTAKRDHNPPALTDFLPFAPQPVQFTVTRDGKQILQTTDFYIGHVRGHPAVNVRVHKAGQTDTTYPCRLRYVRDMIPVLIEGVEIPIARETLSEFVLDKLDAEYDAGLGVDDWETSDVEVDG